MRHNVGKLYLNQEVQEAYNKMVLSCQSGSKKSWRKNGKVLYKLLKDKNLPIDPWMEEHFGRIVD